MQVLQVKSRLFVVATVALAHLMLIRAWRTVPVSAPVPVKAAMRLQVSLLPLTVIEPHAVSGLQQPLPLPPPSLRTKIPASAPSVPATAAITSSRHIASAPEKAISSNESIMTNSVAGTLEPDDLFSAARRSAGKIDRELRQASPRLPGTATESSDSRLARGIAAAGKSSHGMQEVQRFADGRTVTRVGSGADAYCVLNGALPGLDAMQEGRQSRVVSCPQ